MDQQEKIELIEDLIKKVGLEPSEEADLIEWALARLGIKRLNEHRVDWVRFGF